MRSAVIRRLLTPLCLALAWACGGPAATAGYRLLHEFRGVPNDGANPWAELTLSGSTLYGTTIEGGSGSGAVYKINTDGSGFGLIHKFSAQASPQAAVVLSGSTLYGVTTHAGAGTEGTVFKVNADGTGFRFLHEFSDVDGQGPRGSLVFDGAALYGTTLYGGVDDKGTVFKVNASGTGFQLLHESPDGAADARHPWAGPTLSGTTLFGVTQAGGSAGVGTIFKVNTDGTGFELLYEFAGGIADGAVPVASLIVDGSTLYGTTKHGRFGGTVFSIKTDGTDYRRLHDFFGGAEDGAQPEAPLMLSGSTLYGTTIEGGDGDYGTIFKLNTDGSGYEILHEFAGGADDGRFPGDGLTLSGSTLFGVTYRGGDRDLGTIFALDLNSPAPSADYDGNGSVGAEDLAVWHAAFGTDSSADADGDGDSDGVDFLAWQRELGQGSISPSGMSIPEPTARALALILVFCAAIGRAKKPLSQFRTL
jgi:uncharacterized repeat protein (TIGR03803 family)